MTTQQQQPRQPVVYMTQNPMAADSFGQAAQQRAILFYRLGITQICLSGVIMALGLTILVYSIIYQDFYYPYYYDWYGQIGTGVWASCFFFTSGLLGLLSGQRRNRCLVIAGLTMAIFSALAAAALVGLEITGSIAFSWYFYDPRYRVSFGIHICLSILGFAEFVVAIVHASYSCNCNGCDSSQSCCMPTNQANPGTVTYTYSNAAAFQQVPTNQPVGNFYTVAPGQPVVNPQIVQQPYIVTSGPPQQQVPYQIPHAVQVPTHNQPSSF